MSKKRQRWEIFPQELFQGLKMILMITFGGIALLVGAYKWPYPMAIVVMVVSVGFLIWTRKWFE
jgi:hypothetical protein